MTGLAAAPESGTGTTAAAGRPESEPRSGAGSRRGSSPRASALVALGGAVVTTVTNFGIALLLVRAGTATAGVFFAATAVITIVGNSAALGTMTGLTYFLPTVLAGPRPDPRSLIGSALRPVVAASTVAAVVLVGVAVPLASVVADDRTAEVATMVRILALAVPFWAVTVTALGATRGLGSAHPTTVVNNVVRPLAQLLAIGAVVATGPGGSPSLTALALAWAGPVVVGAVIALGAVARLGGLAVPPRPATATGTAPPAPAPAPAPGGRTPPPNREW